MVGLLEYSGASERCPQRRHTLALKMHRDLHHIIAAYPSAEGNLSSVDWSSCDSHAHGGGPAGQVNALTGAVIA